MVRARWLLRLATAIAMVSRPPNRSAASARGRMGPVGLHQLLGKQLVLVWRAEEKMPRMRCQPQLQERGGPDSADRPRRMVCGLIGDGLALRAAATWTAPTATIAHARQRSGCWDQRTGSSLPVRAERPQAQRSEDIILRIADMKRSLIQSKPIGARLDSSRAFVKRCQDRRDAALSALTLARSTVEESEIALAEGLSFLSALEAEMAPPDPAMSISGPDSLESMATSLSRVIAEMKSACAIPPELIAETEMHMQHLMTGVRTIADTASRQAAPQQQAASAAAPLWTAGVCAPAPRTQKPKAAATPARRTRIVGKQRMPIQQVRRRIPSKSDRTPTVPTQAQQQLRQQQQELLHGVPFIQVLSSPEGMSDGSEEQGQQCL